MGSTHLGAKKAVGVCGTRSGPVRSAQWLPEPSTSPAMGPGLAKVLGGDTPACIWTPLSVEERGGQVAGLPRERTEAENLTEPGGEFWGWRSLPCP